MRLGDVSECESETLALSNALHINSNEIEIFLYRGRESAKE